MSTIMSKETVLLAKANACSILDDLSDVYWGLTKEGLDLVEHYQLEFSHFNWPPDGEENSMQSRVMDVMELHNNSDSSHVPSTIHTNIAEVVDIVRSMFGMADVLNGHTDKVRGELFSIHNIPSPATWLGLFPGLFSRDYVINDPAVRCVIDQLVSYGNKSDAWDEIIEAMDRARGIMAKSRVMRRVEGGGRATRGLDGSDGGSDDGSDDTSDESGVTGYESDESESNDKSESGVEGESESDGEGESNDEGESCGEGEGESGDWSGDGGDRDGRTMAMTAAMQVIATGADKSGGTSIARRGKVVGGLV